MEERPCHPHPLGESIRVRGHRRGHGVGQDAGVFLVWVVICFVGDISRLIIKWSKRVSGCLGSWWVQSWLCPLLCVGAAH